MRHILGKFIFCNAVLAMLAGCVSATDPFGMAAGAVANYRLTDFAVDVAPGGPVAVLVTDRRVYVMSGEKAPSHTGLAREGFGVPHGVTTESGAPLAAELTASLAAGLAAAGREAIPVAGSGDYDLAAGRAQLLAAAADRFVHVAINEMKTDTYQSTAFDFDVDVAVYDAQGNELVAKRLTGHEEGRSTKMLPKNRNAEMVATLLPGVLAGWLQDPEVAAALR